MHGTAGAHKSPPGLSFAPTAEDLCGRVTLHCMPPRSVKQDGSRQSIVFGEHVKEVLHGLNLLCREANCWTHQERAALSGRGTRRSTSAQMARLLDAASEQPGYARIPGPALRSLSCLAGPASPSHPLPHHSSGWHALPLSGRGLFLPGRLVSTGRVAPRRSQRKALQGATAGWPTSVFSTRAKRLARLSATVCSTPHFSPLPTGRERPTLDRHGQLVRPCLFFPEF